MRKDQDKTKEELINELVKLRRQIADMEASETKSKKAADLLLEEKNKLEAVITAIGDGITVQDTNFKVLYQNDVHKKRHGNRVGEYCYKAYHNNDKVCNQCILVTSFKDGKLRRQEISFSTDENIKYLEVTANPLRDSKGNIIAGISIIRDITERKQAEEILERLRHQNELILKSAGEGILGLNPYGNHLFVNPSAARMLGYEVAELIGRDSHTTWHHSRTDKSSYPTDECRICATCKGGDLHHVKDEIFWRKDGTSFPVEYTSTPIIEEGKSVGVVITFRDITERKEIEKKLFESEEKYRELVENANSVIMRRNTRGEITFFNEFAQKFFGYSEQEVLGKNVVGTIVPEIDSSGRNLRVMIENITITPEQYTTNENENMRSNGERVWVAWTNKAIRDETGKVTEILCVGNDITERKRAEEALRKSEERYKRMVDAVTAYTYSVEVSEGRAISTQHSMGCLPVTGYNPEDYESYPYLWYSMIHPDDRIMVENSVKEILTVHEVPPIEHRIIRRDGTVVWVRNTMVPHFNEEGRLIRYDGLIEDITERKRLESQLIQAQKMEAVGTLAGGVSHDFNNILTAIISYGNILLMKMGKDDPLRTYVDRILASSERAATLVHSLLTFSRRQIMNPRPADVNKMIQKVKHLLSRLIGEDISLKTLLTDEDLVVMADACQIEQVLMNLATNARDAMPDVGFLTLSTEFIELDDEFIKNHGFGERGKYALIVVEDTGEGMDEETRERIFEPFFTTKEVDKGTGLGLAIAYGIIKQHDGYINCYSEPGKGTTFKIYLPLIKSKVEETEPAAVSIIRGGTETILIAEDNAEVRKIAKDVLEEAGYTVIEAADGEDAINKFMKNDDKIRLAILDVIMPKKNGKEVYETIKEAMPDVKALFTSGYTADIIHKKGILEEGLNLVLKPFSPDKLLRKVREVLDKGI